MSRQQKKESIGAFGGGSTVFHLEKHIMHYAVTVCLSDLKGNLSLFEVWCVLPGTKNGMEEELCSPGLESMVWVCVAK